MCGICGIYYFDRSRPVIERDLTAMRDTMIHRGPDGAGNVVRGHVGLGHRRLSIVDLAGGHQPMANEDESIWITFNGEIYNHRELRPRLVAAGHTFRTRCDTEAIIHSYEQDGWHSVSSLLGMFAFAIYDQRANRLVLARDRIGIKPLYYRVTTEALIFASEIKAIIAHPSVTAEVNWPRVPDFLRYGTVYGEETLFADIRELPPGHVLVATRSGVEVQQYWDLPDAPVVSGNEVEQREQVKRLLRQSIQRRLMSDVPLGAFLSGGLDSSLLVAMMNELTGAPVKTFSIGFTEPGYDEFRYSRMVAQRYHTDHTEIVLDAEQFCEALPGLVWHYDEPIGLRASVPLYFLSRATKGNATVILTGEGADELFLGYDQYDWARRHAHLAAAFQRLCPSPLRESSVRLAQRALGREHLLFERLLMTPAALAASFNEWVPADVIADLLQSDPGSGNGHGRPPADACCDIFANAPAQRDFLSRTTYLHFKTFLVALLMKQDKMSMAASIESRVPYLDHELVEYAYRLPTNRKLSRGLGKKLLKEIAADYLPAELINRPKRGFPVPLIPWLERPATRKYFADVLLDGRTLGRGLLNRRAVEAHLHPLRTGDANAARSNSYLIWNLVNFELWQRTFVDTLAPAAIQNVPPLRGGTDGSMTTTSSA
ncbi:MAG: asparagine synthase (glutamine-hydrolyzing) [Deltaproteobacteria bacterium]|nr:asparagine synthase (glutamine-hydrolyzing) [Deltaproteobacteria bacterium]